MCVAMTRRARFAQLTRRAITILGVLVAVAAVVMWCRGWTRVDLVDCERWWDADGHYAGVTYTVRSAAGSVGIARYSSET